MSAVDWAGLEGLPLSAECKVAEGVQKNGDWFAERHLPGRGYKWVVGLAESVHKEWLCCGKYTAKVMPLYSKRR